MAPHDLRRPFKRPAISDQQKRRDLTLQRQAQKRRDAQQAARFLASSVLSLPSQPSPEEFPAPGFETRPVEIELEEDKEEEEEAAETSWKELDVVQASKLGGAEVRRWFAKQLMLPEWMIDVPDRLSQDWYVFARPSGKRCFVVSINGTTISRVRNGSILHRFPSALPNGARTKDVTGPGQSYSILDCIFHEADQTYYVIDMVCWRGYSLYDCDFEFRLSWLNSKLGETKACEPPSVYHRYRFSTIPVYNCDRDGLLSAYGGPVPYVKDGLLLYNKHAHYQTGNTPLTLVWKDENCSQYVIDTDSKGQVPIQQLVVLELQDGGSLMTSDDPPMVLGCLNFEFIQKLGLQSGNLLRFAVSDGGISFVDGKLEKADLRYIGKVNRARAFADSFSKVMFQHMARHSPLKLDDLLSTVCSGDEHSRPDAEMSG